MAAKRVELMEEEEEKRVAAEAHKRKKEKAALLGIELESPPAKPSKRTILIYGRWTPFDSTFTTAAKDSADEEDGEEDEAVVVELDAVLDEAQLQEAEAVATDRIAAK